jgi:DNA-binding cell septation regulator SpoVG
MPFTKDPALGKHVSIVFKGQNVGEFERITQTHKMNIKEYAPLGKEIPRTLDGRKTFNFTLEKGWIDVELMRLIWGNNGKFVASSATNIKPPRFVVIVATKSPDSTTRETYFDVLIHNYEAATGSPDDIKNIRLECVADGGYDPGVTTPGPSAGAA